MKQTKLFNELLRRTFETSPVVADTDELEAVIVSRFQQDVFFLSGISKSPLKN
jgi:hypothetical protein